MAIEECMAPAIVKHCKCKDRRMFQRILVVCVGNICRSPAAEYLFRHYLSPNEVTVESAGLAALVDEPMSATAMQFLSGYGLDGSAHRGSQLTLGMLRKADLILAMEREHLTHMMCLAPEASGKMLLLDHWGAGRDIIDPYRREREAFDQIYQMIGQAVHDWLPHLVRPPRRPLASWETDKAL